MLRTKPFLCLFKRPTCYTPQHNLRKRSVLSSNSQIVGIQLEFLRETFILISKIDSTGGLTSLNTFFHSLLDIIYGQRRKLDCFIVRRCSLHFRTPIKNKTKKPSWMNWKTPVEDGFYSSTTQMSVWWLDNLWEEEAWWQVSHFNSLNHSLLIWRQSMIVVILPPSWCCCEN